MGRCLGLDEVTRVGLGIRCDHGGIRALKRSDSREIPHTYIPCEDTVKRWPSASQDSY